MISFQDVSFAYPGENNILEGFSLDIKEGEQLAIIGANGAGKSTILKSVLGLLDIRGDIYIDGLKLEKKNLKQIRKSVGYVLQDSDNQMFMPKVIDDLMFGLINYGMSQNEAKKKSEEVLQMLGIAHLAEKHNYKLSTGEKRMAAIATVLAMEPRIMLLDEPSAALDPSNRRKIINTLNSLNITKVIATHDLDLVLDTCERVILINQGRLVADGAVKDILTNRQLLENNNLELPFSMV